MPRRHHHHGWALLIQAGQGIAQHLAWTIAAVEASIGQGLPQARHLLALIAHGDQFIKLSAGGLELPILNQAFNALSLVGDLIQPPLAQLLSHLLCHFSIATKAQPLIEQTFSHLKLALLGACPHFIEVRLGPR